MQEQFWWVLGCSIAMATAAYVLLLFYGWVTGLVEESAPLPSNEVDV